MSTEQFVILAKNQKGRALEALVQQTLNNKKIFVFGELLSLPSVRDLQGTEYDKTFQCLQLFAYGKYHDYYNDKSKYITFTDAMHTKLRQLSIVSLAAENKILSYELLRKELLIEDIRVLEDLIIDSIYAGLISGKMDQRGQIFRVQGTVGRDVLPEQLGSIIEKLQTWKFQCSELISAINASSANAVARRDDVKMENEDLQKTIAIIKASVKDSMASGNLDEEGDKMISQLSATSGFSKIRRQRVTGEKSSRIR